MTTKNTIFFLALQPVLCYHKHCNTAGSRVRTSLREGAFGTSPFLCILYDSIQSIPVTRNGGNYPSAREVRNNGPVTLEFISNETSGDNIWRVELIRVLNEQELAIQRWEIPGKDGGVSFITGKNGLASGEYYIKTTAYKTSLSELDYGIIVKQTEALWEKEDNDTPNTASEIAIGSTYGGTSHNNSSYYGSYYDYYYFNTSGNGYVQVAFSSDETNSGKGWYVRLLCLVNSQEQLIREWLIQGNQNGIEQTLDKVGVQKGRYYLRIEPYGKTQYDSEKEYYFTIYNEEKQNWEVEPNNRIEKATDIVLGETYTGNAHSDYNSYRDRKYPNDDCFRFEISRKDVLSLDFESDETDGKKYWNIRMTDDNEKSLMSWKVYGKDGGTKDKKTDIELDSGTYYLIVTGSDLTDCLSEKEYFFSLNGVNSAIEYMIDVKSGASDLEKSTQGKTITITASEPEEGYTFDKWISEDEITLEDETASTTKFTMPDHNVTVTATYKKIPKTLNVVWLNDDRTELDKNSYFPYPKAG